MGEQSKAKRQHEWRSLCKMMVPGVWSAIALLGSFLPVTAQEQPTPAPTSRSIETQCFRVEHGLVPCTILEKPAQQQFEIRWADGSEHHIRFTKDTLESRTGKQAPWRGVPQAGLCWAWRCFQMEIEALKNIEKTTTPVKATCFDVSGRDSDCTVQNSTEFNGGIVTWPDNRQEQFQLKSSELFYTVASDPTQWIGPRKAGLCAGEVCMFEFFEGP